MTKTLGQIQKENRKFILEATLSGNNLRILKEGISDFSNAPLHLSRVLKGIDPYKNYGFIAGYICKALNKKRYTYAFICEWNLELETLEEQSKETQRAINKILKENNK